MIVVLQKGMLKIRKRYVHQSWAFVMGCVGVVSGMILVIVFRINFFASWWWIVFAVILLLMAFWKPRISFAVMALIAGMVLAFARASRNLIDEEYVYQLYGQTIMVTGTVEGDPDIDEGNINLKLKELQFGEEENNTKNGVLFVSLKSNNEIARDDKITLKGKLSEGFGIFVGYMFRPTVTKWERPSPGNLALALRNWFADRIRNIISEKEGGLGLSYLLGIKTGISDELDESLRVAGLAHIVVTSGAHLSILVGLMCKVFSKISRFVGVLFSGVFIIFFMCMVGFTPSITRAGIMTILTLLAWYSGRRFSAWRIIVITVAITLMMDPSYLLNLGWLLSFASYGGVMILGPRLSKFFYGKKRPGLIGSMVLTTVSATLMTLPLTLYYYSQISLISIVANLLIMPSLPYVMGAVFLSGVLAGVPMLGTVVAFATTKMLSFHMVIVEWFGGMRQFLIEVPKNQWQVFLAYGLIVLLMCIIWARKLWLNNEQFD